MTHQQNPSICTVVSKNYLAYARCLTDSFLQYHPQGQVFVLLVDELEDNFDPTQERFITILAKELNIPDFYQMAFRYFVFELNTAVKPFFFEYLFRNYGLQKLCYFDPDIQFFQPVDEIFTLLDDKGIVILPHLLGFLEDGFHPDEVDILRSGAYNLGFIGLAQHPELETFLRWWQRKLQKHCLGENNKGLFLDQRWIDLVPGLFSSVYIHRDPGCNVAYWNLNHRQVEPSSSGYRVNGSSLKFFHFSGFLFDNIEAVARYQNRFKLSNLPTVASLFYTYHDKLKSHQHSVMRNLRYVYDYFDNGIYISPFIRHLWRKAEEEGHSWLDPFNTQASDSFIHWLNEPVDQVEQNRPLISRLALEIYRQRPDIQQAFPDVLSADRIEFARWLVRQTHQDFSIDPFFLEPIAASLINTSQNNSESLVKGQALSRQKLGTTFYLRARDFFNRIGLGPRVKALIGTEQVFKVRQIFFYGKVNQALLSQPGKSTPTPLIKPDIGNFSLKNSQLNLGLNVIGYLTDETGIGEVARSILKALHQKNFPVAQTNVNGYIARREDESVLHLPTGNPYPINLFNINADQVPTIHRLLGAEFFQHKYNIGFWFWELACFPEMWRDHFAYFKEIWVASSFVQTTLAQAAPIPVVNMRVPVIPPPLSPISRADLGLPQDKHIFLFVFDGLSYLERKNPLGLIRAYRAAFEPHFKDTLLVIKATNLARNPELEQQLQQEMASVSGVLIDQYMNRDELNGLFRACNTYISLHRSEGFGMTLAETMSLGKPVIATAYSANMDFMTPANSYPVGYRLVELEQDYGPYQKGNLWAEPDLNEAAAIMKRVLEYPQEAFQKGQLAKQDITQFYSINAVGLDIIKRLEIIQGWSQ